MKELDEHQKSYIEQMNLWFEEQEMLDKQMERTIGHHEEIADVNRMQLELHRERTLLGRTEFEEWKRENGIEEEQITRVNRTKCSAMKVEFSITDTDVFNNLVKLLGELHEIGDHEQRKRIESFFNEKLNGITGVN